MYEFVSKDVKQDASAFAWNHSKAGYFKALFFFIIITAAALITIFSNPESTKNLVIGLIIVIGTIAFASLSYFGIKKNPLKNQYVLKTKEIKIIFEENKIKSLTTYVDGQNEGECGYDNIIMVKEDSKRIYCYINPQSALILNKDSIENIEEFKTFLRNKVNNRYY